jgi:hypothetical protein
VWMLSEVCSDGGRWEWELMFVSFGGPENKQQPIKLPQNHMRGWLR